VVLQGCRGANGDVEDVVGPCLLTVDDVDLLTKRDSVCESFSQAFVRASSLPFTADNSGLLDYRIVGIAGLCDE
jgi:hypothetical protein